MSTNGVTRLIFAGLVFGLLTTVAAAQEGAKGIFYSGEGPTVRSD
jgi:hypothetical protein